MRVHKRLLAVVCVLAIAITLGAFALVSAQGETYFAISNTTFAGRTTFTLYEHDGTRLGSAYSIHYMGVYIIDTADDDSSLIMTGNYTANTTAPDGAVVMLWESQYGPWANSTAYEAQNMSQCSVGPDYFFICWGLQGDYSATWSGNTKPFLTLEGVGLRANWATNSVEAFGTAQLKTRIYSTRSGNVSTMTKIRGSTMLQLWQAAGAPHELSYKSSSTLPVLTDGAVCWACLWSDFPDWLCDWLYAHFGIDLCYVPE